MTLQEIHDMLGDLRALYGDIPEIRELSETKSVEEFIEHSTAPEIVCWYARYILKNRFPRGEYIIAKDAEYSIYYARFVLKDRFALGENIIKSIPYAWMRYKNYFNIKSPLR